MLRVFNKLFVGGDWNVFLQKNEDKFLILPEKGFWYADPFLFKHNNKIYLFVEAFEKKKELGRIGFLSSDDNFSKLNILISNQYHYSFPNVFSYKDNIYMIPESSEEHAVYLYKFDSFPLSPLRVARLLSGEYVDTSLIKKEEEFCIFSSYDNQFKKIVFFKFNFVNNSVEILNNYDDIDNSLRPAGNAFVKDGMIVAPFQCCKNKYGEKIILKIIEICGDKVVINNEVGEIGRCDFDFAKKNGRIHTYNRCDECFVIDYMNERFSLLKSVHMLKRKLRRKAHTKECKKQ